MLRRVAAEPPLVLHVLYRFDVGGLENGVVNLINHLPAQRYRHAVLAIDSVATTFAQRITRPDVLLHALHKPPGHALSQYPRIWRWLRELAPDIVHTRNLAALELQLPAWLAGVAARVHGEHGRDMADLDGNNVRLQRLRRLYRPLVHQYVALSRELQTYLVDKVRVPPSRINQIYNGVDTQRFRPGKAGEPAPAGCPFTPGRHWLVGTVGRMQAVKDQPTLVRAFVQALQRQPAQRERLRLVLVGDGPLLAECRALLDAAGLTDLAWLPGERSDIPELLGALDCMVLPSLAEGVSNTILEAMATGLPVLATDVGANADLVLHGQTGEIVAPADVAAMADALLRTAADPGRAQAMGRAGRAEVERRFSLTAMVDSYADLYDRLLAQSGRHGRRR